MSCNNSDIIDLTSDTIPIRKKLNDTLRVPFEFPFDLTGQDFEFIIMNEKLEVLKIATMGDGLSITNDDDDNPRILLIEYVDELLAGKYWYQLRSITSNVTILNGNYIVDKK